MVAELLSADDLSGLVEEVIGAEYMAVELAESGAPLSRINVQLSLVGSLHQRIAEYRVQLGRTADTERL